MSRNTKTSLHRQHILLKKGATVYLTYVAQYKKWYDNSCIICRYDVTSADFENSQYAIGQPEKRWRVQMYNNYNKRFPDLSSQSSYEASFVKILIYLNPDTRT